MARSLIEIKLKKEIRIIPDIAQFVADSAAKLGLSERKRKFLCFTLETALDYRMNALDDSNSELTLTIEDTGSYFKFSVMDLGAPYILTANQQRILNRKLVDKYSFEQRGRKGQCFSFAYKYEAVPADAEKFEKLAEELLDDNIKFARVEDSDESVLEAVKCLYDVYGYDYYHQHLYSVEGFRRYMSNGRYVPILGTNDHGQSLCYCALDENEWFLSVPEFSNLVTKDIARGRGIGTAAFRESERIAKEMNYAGIHVSAVAYHPYTQKMCNKLGYTPTAIEYALNPAGSGGYDADRRLDGVIAVKIFDKNKAHELYIPEECNELFEKIYEAEHLKYSIHNEEVRDEAADIKKSDSFDCEKSILSYVIDTDTENCFFKIDECGQNVREDLESALNNEEVRNSQVITVNLNMNHPSAIAGYKALKELGFICTGCIPACDNGDFMLLQSFKVEPEYDKIVLEPNYKLLADEVRKLNRI